MDSFFGGYCGQNSEAALETAFVDLLLQLNQPPLPFETSG